MIRDSDEILGFIKPFINSCKSISIIIMVTKKSKLIKITRAVRRGSINLNALVPSRINAIIPMKIEHSGTERPII